MRFAALDIGGTHARLAVATIGGGGTVSLGEPFVLRTNDYCGLEPAWRELSALSGETLKQAAIAIAAPIRNGTARMTNAGWTFTTSGLAQRLGLDRVLVLNDFAAVAHAVANAPVGAFLHLAGPRIDLPASGAISVIGPGTGLGVACLLRGGDTFHVQASEGAHIGFAPADAIDDVILKRLRMRHGRVSTERVVSGPGIVGIHAALHGLDPATLDEKAIWEHGLAGSDSRSAASVGRFCRMLGSVAGDIALAHGSTAVTIAGGLGYRLRHVLPGSGFADGFVSKGRYRAMMANMPVKLANLRQPGLLGAATAFVREIAP